MFGMGKRRSLVEEMVMGAAAGIAGTWVLGKVMAKLQEMGGEEEPEPIEEEQKEDEGTQLLAKRMMHMVGVEPTEKRKQKFGQAIHWGYGISWGAAYGVLRNRVPQLSWGMGIPFGIGLGLVSSELLLTLTGLAPPPTKRPAQHHAGTLAAHLAYAAAADGSYRMLERTIGDDSSRVGKAWGAARRMLR